jgi:arginase
MTLKRKTVHIVGACMDLGSGRRGVDMGPSALRLAGLNQKIGQLGYRVKDEGNLLAPIAESGHYGKKTSKYLPEITDFCRELAKSVSRIVRSKSIPLVLGGDHTIAIASISAISHEWKKKNKDIAVLWIDAHTDMNTPQSSPSGNVHGMPLAVLLGQGPRELKNISGKHTKLKARNVACVGIRSVDPSESLLVKKSNIHVKTMRDIDENGIRNVINQTLDRIEKDCAGLWISLDMDACDPSLAPGVGTPVPGGLSYRESHLIMELVADRNNLLGMDIVEINPIIDQSNQTAILASELVLSALGKKIL